MRTLTLRRAAVTVALPLALTSLAACGSNQGATTATDPAAGGGNAALTSTAKPVDKAQFLKTLKAAAQKITTVDVAMQMNMSGQKMPVKGTIDMTGDSPAMQMTVTIPGLGSATEMRLVDKSLYVQMPGGGGKFVKLDLSDPNGPLGSLGGDALNNVDPGSITSELSASMLKKVTDHGVSSVGGQKLHHYSAVMNLGAAAKALKNLPSTASLPKTARYDVWLDDQGRFARFVMLVPNTMRVSATYTHYGTAAHVVAPPASEVTSASGLLGSSLNS